MTERKGPCQPPGWSFPLVYATSIGDLLLCSVCKQALVEPVVHQGGCGDMVCRACVAAEHERVASGGPVMCPMCKRIIGMGALVPAPRVIMSKLNNLLVVCPTCQKPVKRGESIDHYQHCASKCKNGCGELVVPAILDIHNQNCLGTVVRCDRCSKSMTRRALQEHKMECPVDCPQGCGQHIAPKDQSAHNAVCPEVQVPCPLFMFQCKWLGKRKDQKSHTDKCTALREFVVGLKKENSKLKEEMKTLSDRNQELKTEKERLNQQVQLLTPPYFDFVTVCTKEEEIENQHPGWSQHEILVELAQQCPGIYPTAMSTPARVKHMRDFRETTLPDTRIRIQALLRANEEITRHWKADEFALPEWGWLNPDQQISAVESMLEVAHSSHKRFTLNHLHVYIEEAAKKHYPERYKAEHVDLPAPPKYSKTPKKNKKKKHHKRRSSTSSSAKLSTSPSHSHRHSHSRTPPSPSSHTQSTTVEPQPSESSTTTTTTTTTSSAAAEVTTTPTSTSTPTPSTQHTEPRTPPSPQQPHDDQPVSPQPKKHRPHHRHSSRSSSTSTPPITTTTTTTPSTSSSSTMQTTTGGTDVDSIASIIDSDDGIRLTVTGAKGEAIYARNQFVALGVGVIVGRCGNNSHVRSLTAPLLSELGHRWVVTSERDVVVKVTRTGVGSDNRGPDILVNFTVSPTLGLVRAPVVLDFRGDVVGSVSDVCSSDGDCGRGTKGNCGRRLVVVKKVFPVLGTGIVMVRDLDVAGIVSFVGSDIQQFDRVECNRDWVAISGRSLRIWKVEDVLTVGPSTEADVSVGEKKIINMKFVEGDSLFIFFMGGGSFCVDLPSTHSTKTLCGKKTMRIGLQQQCTLWSHGDHIYSAVLCVGCCGGTSRRITKRVLCVTNGETITGNHGNIVHVGGPYYAKYVSTGDEGASQWEVFSVCNPNLCLCVHRDIPQKKAPVFGHTLVVFSTGGGSSSIFRDALTGTHIFTMKTNTTHSIAAVF
ncbi:TNF receptor-associated factor 5 [Pelomyxa schiedti]|nr:TNF receptor-associated factor 5 [Pelomyxa schiedti]